MITQQQLDAVGEWVTKALANGPLSDEIVPKLRQQFSEIHFTYCMDDDVYSGRPVLEQSLFNLYLIDSSNHCLCFTSDRELATGIVVAEVEEA